LYRQVFIGQFAGEVTDHITCRISSQRLSTDAITYRDEMLDWRSGGDAGRGFRTSMRSVVDPLCSFVSARLNSIAKAEVRDVVFADQASTQNLCTANLGVVDERSAL
jgi:hypothetical protein